MTRTIVKNFAGFENKTSNSRTFKDFPEPVRMPLWSLRTAEWQIEWTHYSIRPGLTTKHTQIWRLSCYNETDLATCHCGHQRQLIQTRWEPNLTEPWLCIETKLGLSEPIITLTGTKSEDIQPWTMDAHHFDSRCCRNVTSTTTLPVFCSRLITYLFSVSFPSYTDSPSAFAVSINLGHLKYFKCNVSKYCSCFGIDLNC